MNDEPSLRETAIIQIKKRYIELLLISTSILLLGLNFYTYLKYESADDHISSQIENKSYEKNVFKSSKIYVDVGGAVVHSGVYEISSSARLNDAIREAGGLSEHADIGYFERTFNRSRFIFDGEKIYVPSYADIQYGLVSSSRIVIEPEYTIEKNRNKTTLITSESTSPEFTNINTASEEELDELPGIGVVTANKIISNRPYSSIEELLEKKIIKTNVYEQIKNMITL